MALAHSYADPYTPETVKAQIAEAADTMRRLRVSGGKPSGYKTNWPSIVQDFWEAYDTNKSPIPLLASPKPEAIDRMDATLRLLYTIEDATARGVVWGMACGLKVSRMARALGISRYYVEQLHRDNLTRLAKRLNGCL
jgi:hypothetical protein